MLWSPGTGAVALSLAVHAAALVGIVWFETSAPIGHPATAEVAVVVELVVEGPTRLAPPTAAAPLRATHDAGDPLRPGSAVAVAHAPVSDSASGLTPGMPPRLAPAVGSAPAVVGQPAEASSAPAPAAVGAPAQRGSPARPAGAAMAAEGAPGWVPAASGNALPQYPALARRRGIEGVTLILVEVLENGAAGGVRVARSSGSRLLDAAAELAVMRWRFRPAPGVRPAPGTIAVPIRFSLVD